MDNWDTEVTCHLQEEVCTCSPERRNLFVVGGGFDFVTFSLKNIFSCSIQDQHYVYWKPTTNLHLWGFTNKIDQQRGNK